MKQWVDIVSYITPLKAWNAFQVLVSYYASRIRSKSRMVGMPISMSIEPTTACNLGCPHCPSGLKQFTRPTGNLKMDLFTGVIDQVKDHLVYLTLYFQGEPFINPKFLQMVKYAHDKGIYTSTSTNAHFIEKDTAKEIIDSGLNRLIISMDGIDQESYVTYRVGGELEKVISGIRNLVSAKKDRNSAHPFIELQFIVFKHNEDQIETIKSLSKEWGVDKLVLKTAQIYDFESSDNWLPENEDLARYKRNEGLISIKNKLFNHCWRMWHSCVVTWDGSIVPCCFDKDAEHAMGSLQHNSFIEIWENRTYSRFRDQILHSRKSIEICTNCTEGTKWMI